MPWCCNSASNSNRVRPPSGEGGIGVALTGLRLPRRGRDGSLGELLLHPVLQLGVAEAGVGSWSLLDGRTQVRLISLGPSAVVGRHVHPRPIM